MLSKLNSLLLPLLFIQTMLILIWNNNLAIRAWNGFINEVWIDISTSWDGNFQLSLGFVNLDPLLKFTLLLLSLKSSGVFTQITQALLSSCWVLSLLCSSWQISLLFSLAFKASCKWHIFCRFRKYLGLTYVPRVPCAGNSMVRETDFLLPSWNLQYGWGDRQLRSKFKQEGLQILIIDPREIGWWNSLGGMMIWISRWLTKASPRRQHFWAIESVGVAAVSEPEEEQSEARPWRSVRVLLRALNFILRAEVGKI